MEDETSKEVEQAIEGALVSSRAEEAYRQKLSGSSLSEIADDLGYRSTTEVVHAINSLMKQGAVFITEAGRAGFLQMELDRLDILQTKAWPSAMTGDPRSIEAVLKIMDRRIKITGLDSVDTATQQNTVLVIGGQEQDYLQKLKELAGSPDDDGDEEVA